MTSHSPIRKGASLLERAAEVYDFSSGMLIAPVAEPMPVHGPEPVSAPAPQAPQARAPQPQQQPVRRRAVPGRRAEVDRARLSANGFLLPDAPASALAEELRLVKRQVISNVTGKNGIPDGKRRSILVSSAQPDEGKTFCALNLALSLAAEQDLDVLLVDGDFAKPEIPALLGIEPGPGLVDALADRSLDPESMIIATDLGSLSILPAGGKANNVPELLASDRTRELLAALAAADPRRIVIFDSPPALVASPASLLAGHVGQVLVVVHADKTTESDLREAIGLLSACDHVGLVLNKAGFAAGGRRFGSYYGQEP